jgi:hypothetical protein
MGSVADSLAKIAQLALGFLSLTLEILLTALLLEVLAADEVANSFLSTADGLVPCALSAVRVVFGRCARGADGEGTSFGSGVREIRLGFPLSLVLVGFGLWNGVRDGGG